MLSTRPAEVQMERASRPGSTGSASLLEEGPHCLGSGNPGQAAR